MAAKEKQRDPSAAATNPAASLLDTSSSSSSSSSSAYFFSSSSPDSTPTQLTEVYMFSLPDSVDSLSEHVEAENAAALPPPDHQCRISFEKVTQNPPDELKTVDLGVKCRGSRRARVSDDETGTEAASKRARVPGEDINGEDENAAVEPKQGYKTNVVASGSEDSAENDVSAMNVAPDDSPGRIKTPAKYTLPKVNANDEAHRAEKNSGSSCLGETSIAGKIGNGDAKHKCFVVGNGTAHVKTSVKYTLPKVDAIDEALRAENNPEGSCLGEKSLSGKIGNEDAKHKCFVAGNGTALVKTLVKYTLPKVDAIDEASGAEKNSESSCLGEASVAGKIGNGDAKHKSCVVENGSDREKMEGENGVKKLVQARKMGSREGKEIKSNGATIGCDGGDNGNDDGLGKRSGSMAFLDMMKLIGRSLDKSADNDDDDDDLNSEDILEVAKKQGITFPRPRWWAPKD
ncbi:uncharacterized protein LOC127241126 [Andrographis paniculata]|uniref:uncharacterized protein LOC127241126 n=1 Tax=Andrographis paniculata TaxID=175694 RepID=UPI0021E6F1EF|nr:uncharacterized protein LOC127241126 [Andrographis paniculata]XP_051115988.1 uncharacterized protein LOC127241126 [Andrographis paniculata]